MGGCPLAHHVRPSLPAPHLLVVHLLDGGRAGAAQGWTSKDYRTARRAVDRAMGAVLEILKEQGLLTRTTVFVTSLQ
ncbi:MAG: alkaline phosphatase family protein [Nitrospira sp.]|nr:alkaline phosphatase family protein [Nitrospira sp.]